MEIRYNVVRFNGDCYNGVRFNDVCLTGFIVMYFESNDIASPGGEYTEAIITSTIANGRGKCDCIT